MLSKLKVFLATLLAVGMLTCGVFYQKVEAYQFTGISDNTDANRHRQLLWVYNSDDVAHENGDVVVWKDGSVADGLEISTTTSAQNSLVAGVVAPATIAASSWGFIQTHGYHSAITIGVANSAGDCLTTSTTGEAAELLTLAIATTTVTSQTSVFAVALEATTSSTTVKGFILK